MGVGAFGYDFGALENADNKLTKSYTNMMYGSLFRHESHSHYRFSQVPRVRKTLKDLFIRVGYA